MIVAIKYFFHLSKLPRSRKQIYITLLSTKPGLQKANDYWPISSCNTMYKVVAKVLVNGIKPALPSLISKERYAFVGNCGIMHNILLAQEAMHSVFRAF